MNTAITTEIDKRGVATVTLNAAQKHNAFDDVMIAALSDAFDELNGNPAVRVVILAAKGKSFSAGADLNWMKRMAGFDDHENFEDAKSLATMLYKLNTLNKPTIARVQGPAFGGGIGLISCCDIAIACDSAHFCLSEVKLGMVPATISPYVIEAIGARAARRFFLSAERFNAHKALELGLISEYVSADSLDSGIEKIVEAIVNNGPQALAIAKKLVRDVSHCDIDEQLITTTSQLIADVRRSTEAREGLSAFLEKRKPQWVTEQAHV